MSDKSLNESALMDVLSPRAQGKTVAPPRLGTKGVHDSYHLSPAEKELLATELRNYLKSRVQEPGCPSCMWDVLFAAVYDHAKETLDPENLRTNSGVAGDFEERGADWAMELFKIAQLARAQARKYLADEKRTGLFRDGRSVQKELDEYGE